MAAVFSSKVVSPKNAAQTRKDSQKFQNYPHAYFLSQKVKNEHFELSCLNLFKNIGLP